MAIRLQPADFAHPGSTAVPPRRAAKWTGAPKYNFTGGNNDPDAVPLEGLMQAAQSVLAREGRTLSHYGLASGPQGYRPLREFLAAKLKRDAGIDCTADDILIVSGSLQALDLVNGALLTRGDTVIVEQDNYQGTLTRLHAARRQRGRHPARPRRHAHGRARSGARRSEERATCGRNSSTPSRPCRTRPPPSWTRAGARRCSSSPTTMACRSSRTTATPI